MRERMGQASSSGERRYCVFFLLFDMWRAMTVGRSMHVFIKQELRERREAITG